MRSARTSAGVSPLALIVILFNSCSGGDAALDHRGSSIVHNPVAIDSPIRAAFIAPNTPGSGVPSHGTDKYGETYAIDFVIVDGESPSRKPYRSSFLRYAASGLDLGDFYGFGESVRSPVDGKVVRVVDGIGERNPVSILGDLANTVRVTRDFESGLADYTVITGNCVFIEYGRGAYCLLAHLRNGSIRVEENQRIAAGELIAELGHSGNSTMPHLHMQLMDSMDFRIAKGLPFVLREFSVLESGRWVRRVNALPKKGDILRFP